MKRLVALLVAANVLAAGAATAISCTRTAPRDDGRVGTYLPITIAGDLTGSVNSQTVQGLQGASVTDAAVSRGALLEYGDAGWAPIEAGPNGYLLQSNGAGTDPTWVAPGQPVTDLDCDLTAQSTQTLSTDTTYTICGLTWTKVNSANDNSAAVITNGTGLTFTPKSATNIGGSTLTAPYLRIPITSVIPTFSPNMAIQIWFWVSASNEAANNDEAVAGLMIYNAGYANQYTLQFFRGYSGATNGWGAEFTVLQSNVTSTSTSVNFTGSRVGVASFPSGVFSGLANLFVGTTVTAGAWPAPSALILVAMPAITAGSSASVASASSGQHGISDINLYLTAYRNGSGTAFVATFGRFMIRHAPLTQ